MTMIEMPSYPKKIKRQAATIRYAFLNMFEILNSRGGDSKGYIMDYECSCYLKFATKKYTIDI